MKETIATTIKTLCKHFTDRVRLQRQLIYAVHGKRKKKSIPKPQRNHVTQVTEPGRLYDY